LQHCKHAIPFIPTGYFLLSKKKHPRTMILLGKYGFLLYRHWYAFFVTFILSWKYLNGFFIRWLLLWTKEAKIHLYLKTRPSDNIITDWWFWIHFFRLACDWQTNKFQKSMFEHLKNSDLFNLAAFLNLLDKEYV
jgi:hypothetical protein